MKKVIGIIVSVIIFLANFFVLIHLITNNENNIFDLVKETQAKSLYQISLSTEDTKTPEDLTKYVKSLKVSSNENWYLFDEKNNNFILYKDKSNQKIKDEIKSFFETYKNSKITSTVLNDESENKIVLSIKEVTINNTNYLIGVSEYTTSVLNNVNNQNFNIYVYGETIILSLLSFILIITLNIKDSDHKKEINKIQKEFDEYKSIFAEANIEQEGHQENKESKPIKNENGEYNLNFLDLIVPKLKNDNILYNIYNIPDIRYWIIEDYMQDNVYKIRKDSDNIIILLINGTEKQKKLLEEFDE